MIRPARPLARAALYAEPHGVPTEPHSLAMFVGRVEAVVLTALWGLATCSPRTLIYLPMRGATPPRGMPCTTCELRPLDLVLLHHSLQLPLSRWKEIRSRLGQGTAHTASVPPSAFTAADGMRVERDLRTDNRDLLRVGIAADTIFITGSSLMLRRRGVYLRSMLNEAGPYLKRFNGKYHYCVELGDHDAHPWFRRKRRHPTQVHIQYCPRWQAA